MNTHKQLLEILLTQHAELRKMLVEVAKETENEAPNSEWLLDELILFRTKLDEHLHLEDGVFYPEVLKVLKDHGESTTNTEKFVAEMKDLGAIVYGYLDKYATIEAMVENSREFKTNIQDMAAKILLRVSVEEEGVYLYLRQGN
jgi:hemerythrin-like domain-containing protein